MIIFAIASSVRTPICVDSVTSKPALERTFGHFARVLVYIDLAQDLKYEVLVERKGYAFVVEFEYENLPEFCDYCKTVSHNVSVCRKRNTGADVHANDYVHSSNNAAKYKEAGKQQNIAQNQKKGWVQKDTAVAELNGEETTKLDVVENNVSETNTVADCDQQQQDNNFANLSPIDNRDSRGVCSNQNAVFSNQLVEDSDVDDQSSQASEFVDATQRLETDNLDTSLPTPDRVQNDMRFLNDAWANVADVDEDQIRLQQEALIQTMAAEANIDHQINKEVQTNIDNSRFQLVTRKSTRKKPIKASSKASTSHLSKLKVPSKHFK